MKKKTIWITSAVVGAVLVLGGAGIAVAVTDPFDLADNDRLSGTTLERASSAALDAVGSGTVTDAETSDGLTHAYEVEVTLANGEDIDVELDESFAVVRVDGRAPADASAPAGSTPTSSATPGSGDLAPLTDADRSSASEAALAALPAGTVGMVTEVERSDDFDHAYEVEITLENGEDIDVELGADFAVVKIDGAPAV